MVWKHVGYVGFTRKKDRILVALKHQYYVANLAEVRELLDKKREFALIYEPPKVEKEIKQQ